MTSMRENMPPRRRPLWRVTGRYAMSVGVVARLIIVSAKRGLSRYGATQIVRLGYGVAVIPRRWCDSIGGDVRAVLDATDGSSKAAVMAMQRKAADGDDGDDGAAS